MGESSFSSLRPVTIPASPESAWIASPNHQVARCNPAPAHDVERVAGRRVDVIAAKLDVQQLVVLPDKYFFDDLQRQLADLDLYISV